MRTGKVGFVGSRSVHAISAPFAAFERATKACPAGSFVKEPGALNVALIRPLESGVALFPNFAIVTELRDRQLPMRIAASIGAKFGRPKASRLSVGAAPDN